MSKATGTYTTQRDGGLEYEYDATWDRTSGTLTWSARVRRRGQSFAVIDGQVNLAPGIADLEGVVRRLVESSIERRVGVD